MIIVTVPRRMKGQSSRVLHRTRPAVLFLAVLFVAVVVMPRIARAQAVFVVTDAGSIAGQDGVCDAVCTLDEAILAANGHANVNGVPDRIEFRIGSGAVTYTPGSDLTEITDPVVIDATTQPGYAGVPLITIDGDAEADNLFVISSGGTTLMGLVVIDGAGNGITIMGAGGNTIKNCFIADNFLSGILIDDSPGNIIGGSTETDRNVIYNNDIDGIEIKGGLAKSNKIIGNYIGVEQDGATPGGNDEYGISIETDASGNNIGGSGTGEGNVVSGNDSGIIILSASNNLVQGNIIGLAADGSTIVSNSLVGIRIEGGSFGNTIGGTASGARNVIGGNGLHGLFIFESHSNTVQGNFIGTDETGTSAAGNGEVGILISLGSLNMIGGDAPGARNVISANSESGIWISESIDNEVAGNYIGTNASGMLALGNGTDGILLTNASQNTIGGLSSGAGNLVSGNVGHGVNISALTATAEGNVVNGNFIGTNAVGAVSSGLGNGDDGVHIRNDAAGHAARKNSIGGMTAGAGNTIAGNGGAGVVVFEDGASDGVDNPILGNSIFQNAGLGIDLGDDGVTANDHNDPDDGANQEQNFPILGLATSNGSTTVSGTLNSRPNTTYRVEFFSVTTPDTPGSNGEGEVYLGFIDTATDNLGNTVFSAVLSGTLAEGTYVTSTATELDVDDTTPLRTSEFGSATIVGSSIIVVNSTANTDDGVCEPFDVGPPVKNCTLREAINLANSTVGITDIITFNIPGTGPHMIDVSSGVLPVVDDPVVIDGTTEPDYVGVPVIEIAGKGVVFGGLGLGAGHSTVRGLAFTGFTSAGIQIGFFDGNVIEKCYIGVNPAGTSSGTGGTGIWIHLDSSGNTIGGSTADRRNVISGNDVGVTVETDENTIQNNYIGTNVSGDGAVGNVLGVLIEDGAENIIADNLISGNGDGIFLEGSGAIDNVIIGNLIGTSAAGDAGVGNDGIGIRLMDAADNNVIGGIAESDRNVVSGNGGHGIFVDGFVEDVTGTIIQGNYIGVSADGTAELGNGDHGIFINLGSNGNTIGGSVPGARNVISGNGQSGSGSGIVLVDAGTDGNVVRGNYIGTNAAGTQAMANASQGIAITDGADNNVVGGTASGAGNLISGNGDNGVLIADDGGASPTGNVVRGNWIGTQADGSSALGNTNHGVLIDDADGNPVGGTASGAGNVIAHNGKDGVAVIGGGNNNPILRNVIFSNGGHSIDLGNNGITFNDLNDVDVGENGLQNYPVLTQAASNGSATTVLGTLNSEAGTSYRIEFFSTPTLGTSGQREARTFLGATNVVTGAANNASIVALLSAGVADGHYVVATATDIAENRTSELSAPVQATSTASSTITQACTLGPGWDWFSINVDPSDTDIDDVLDGVNAETNDIIKNPNTGAFSVWDGGTWVGPLTSITAGTGYKIKLTDQGSISVSGPATTATFPVVSGWNSIGFLRQSSEATGTYLASLSLTMDDLIKSDAGTFSVYDGAVWVGSLNTLEPCEGYMLKVQDAGTLSKAEPDDPVLADGALSSPDWHVNPAAFEHSMNIIGVLEIEGRDAIEPADMVAAFAGEEVRGYVKPIDVNGTMMFFLTVFGRADEEAIRFEVYDSVTDAVRESDATLPFVIDGLRGSTAEPYLWRTVLSATNAEDEGLPSAFTLEQNFPNPFNPVTRIEYTLAAASDVTLEVLDLHGRKVRTLVAARQTAGRYGVEWNGRGGGGEQVASGMYFYRLQAGPFVQIRKLMLVK